MEIQRFSTGGGLKAPRWLVVQRPVALCLIALFGPACASGGDDEHDGPPPISTPGQGRRLFFSYDDDLGPGEILPLAVSDSEIVGVTDAPAAPFLPLAAVESSAPDVVTIEHVGDVRASIHAWKPGASTLTATTTTGVRDTIEITASEPRRVETGIYVFASGDARKEVEVLLRGGVTTIWVVQLDAQGHSLAGIGTAPIAVSPPGAVDIGIGTFIHQVQLNALGSVTLEPLGGTPVELPAIVEASTVTGLELMYDRPPPTLKAGDVAEVVPIAHAGDALVGGDYGLFGVENQTPDTCSLEPIPPWMASAFFRLRGVAPGDCRMQLTLGGSSATLSVGVSP